MNDLFFICFFNFSHVPLLYTLSKKVSSVVEIGMRSMVSSWGILQGLSESDTSPPWESMDDSEYHGNFSEYPAYIDKSKKGLWLAVEDFLQRHPEWTLDVRYINCHGFTILERQKDE